MSRTRQQYNQFRRAYHKWLRGLKTKYGSYKLATSMLPGSTSVLDAKDKIIDSYTAPDYIRYMSYWVRRLRK